ncbi:MAG TPA: glucoamylase family protein [Allosphingosinicella sp.]|nr:glucoamylase family protein [Allosphingosinicella sp.]
MISRRSFLSNGASGLAVASVAGAAPARPLAADPGAGEAFLHDVQRRTFRFFWETTNPANGLAADRWPTKSFSSIAATGFALTALAIGAQHGFVDRGRAAERALATLRFFAEAPQGEAPVGMTGYRGFFYHFLDQTTGMRFGRTELSTIDTALLLAGALAAKHYFDRPRERAIGELADRLVGRVDWSWAMPRRPLIAMGWHPEAGFIPRDWTAYNEAMLIYILALGAARDPAPPASWAGWLATAPSAWRAAEGIPHLAFPPLFGHQYSHVWIDFRDIRDSFCRAHDIDYFENSRRAVRAQHAYAIRNPMGWKGYGPLQWGLTACDGPADVTLGSGADRRQFRSYAARGPGEYDDGTLSPTAVGGSVPFAPGLCIATLEAMARRHGSALYDGYGFADAFNPSFDDPNVPTRQGRVIPGRGWYDRDRLGIDQGPILAMIENYRSGLVWKLMRDEPVIRRGLARAGFTGGWLE